MHQGVAPAVDALEGLVIGSVEGLGVLAQQAGLAELVAVSGRQGHHLIGAAGALHMGLQVAIGVNEGSKGLDGIKGHDKNSSEAQPI